MKKIIFTNQKGGVGKTTLCRELGFYLADQGLKVLLVDCDSQGNLSKGLPVITLDGGSLYAGLEGEEIEPIPVAENLSLLSADVKLAALEKRLVGEFDAYERLKALLDGERFRGFDLALLDTPPSLGILTVNALAACDQFVIPMLASIYAMQGANEIMKTVSKVRRSLNPDLSLLGVIVNAFDALPLVTRTVKEEIQDSFGLTCFANHLSKSIRIEEAIALKEGLVNLLGRRYQNPREEIAAIGCEFLKRLEP